MLTSALNVKALIQEKALVGAFSVFVKYSRTFVLSSSTNSSLPSVLYRPDDAVEGLLLGDVVHDDGAHGVPVVGGGDGAVALLARGVPHLHLHTLVLCTQQASHVNLLNHGFKWILVLQKVPSEANPKVRNHGEGPY